MKIKISLRLDICEGFTSVVTPTNQWLDSKYEKLKARNSGVQNNNIIQCRGVWRGNAYETLPLPCGGREVTFDTPSAEGGMQHKNFGSTKLKR